MNRKSQQRRRLLLILLGASVGGGAALIINELRRKDDPSELADKPIQPIDNPNPNLTPDKVTLKELAAAKGLLFGAAIRGPDLFANPQLAELLAREARIIVPEWELKWAVGDKPLRNSPTGFDFTMADRMAEYAKQRNLLFRGHALVWHESLPDWFKTTVNAQNARQFLVDHINQTVGHYAGRIHSWDVVNEAIAVEQKQPNGLRKTPWLELLGEDYIELAFRTAAKADPKALLVYNDYGLEYDKPDEEAKRNAVIQLLKRLKAKGVPIHALGIQAHLEPGENRIDRQKLSKFLQEVAGLGLKIMITELDVIDQKLPQDIENRDRLVYKAYREYLDIVLTEPAVIAVITWGLSDRYNWLTEFKPRQDGAAVRPLPYDENLQPKLAWQAIARSFDLATKR
jgi:endo-1,4-beta-xylanase